MPDERSLSAESGFSIIGAAFVERLLFLMPKRAGVAENAAAVRRINVCRSEEREMREGVS